MNRKRILAVLMVAALVALGLSPPPRSAKSSTWSSPQATTFRTPGSGDVEQAGGTIIKGFPQIGLAVATSADPDFPAKAKGIAGIRSVVPDPVAESTPTRSCCPPSPRRK